MKKVKKNESRISTQLRLPVQLMKDLKKISRKMFQSQNQIVIQSVQEYVKRFKQDEENL